MNKKKILILLFAILFFAVLLRFYRIDKNPPSLNLDEVAIGYNAYSILKTGRDEYGERFPLAFRSHDDYKPPLYIYLTAPSIAIFGLNEFAVRFPSALAGSLTILLTYFLTRELFLLGLGKKRAEAVALISSLLLAINPWHLQFSRAGFETNLAVFFTVLAALAFFLGLKKQAWWYLTATSAALALYTYQAARLFIPLFSLALIIIFAKSIKNNLRPALTAAFLFIVLVLPLIPLMTSTAGIMRFKGTSVFEHPGLIQQEVERLIIDARRQDRFAIEIYHNRFLAVFFTLADGYLKHFRPDVLFLGMWGPPVNYTPNVGLLYLLELPLVLWGAHSLLGIKSKKVIATILSWMLLAPVAASGTIDVPSSTRTTIILPTFQILSALGVVAFFDSLRSWDKRAQKAGLVILSVAFAFSLARYLHQYHVHAPLEFAESWQYGYKQAVEYADQHSQEYDRIIVSNNLRQPQNFFAFYTQYDPRTYIFVDGGTVSGGFLEGRNKFGKYEFHEIDYGSLDRSQRLLLIDLYDRMHSQFRDNALEVISLPNNEPIIAIART